MTRDFPRRPVAAVAGVVFREAQVLLVRRKVPPHAGRWSLPGGAVEVGETMREAVVREVREETGLDVEPMEFVGVYDSIVEEGGRVRFHFTLVDFLCRPVGGRLRAGTDAAEVRWVALQDLDGVDLTPLARTAIGEAQELLEADEGSSDA